MISKNSFMIMSFIILSILSISSVSAVSYSVDESLDSLDIQELLDGSGDITGLHFTGASGGLYNNLMLSIEKSINITCDVGVVLSGFSDGDYWGGAFDILADNGNITDFTLKGYTQAISDSGVNNLKIVNNTASDTIWGIFIEYSNNVNVSNNNPGIMIFLLFL